MILQMIEKFKEEICKYCEEFIIEGSSMSPKFLCEGSFCEEAQEAFAEFNETERILVLDIETTGFLAQGGSIVEIGIVELNLLNGEITEVYNSLCKEEILSAKHRDEPFGWIFKNSDLTVEEVRNAPPFEKVKEEVQKILIDYPLGCTAFNNRFDFGFLEDRGLKFPKKLPCPMLLSTPLCKIPKQNGYGSYKWPTVEEAFAHFFPETEYSEKHRGADDAKHEAMIVYKLFELGEFKV